MQNKSLNINYSLLDVYLRTGKIGIALSGGVDSMVLFDVLHKRLEQLGLAKTALEIIHFHHGLREESDVEYETVKKLVEEVGANFTGVHLDVETYQREHKLSFESAASRLRYQHFETFYKEKKLTGLFLGHHQNDLAESVLMKLVNGGYSKSLICMSKELYKNDVRYYRPFLHIKKQTLYAYAATHNLLYFEDMSNGDTQYTRNRYRKTIVPLLEQENPKLSDTLAQFSRDKADDESYFDSVVATEFSKLVKQITYELDDTNLIITTCSKREYLALPNAIKKRLFFRLLKTVSKDEIVSIGHYDELCRTYFENSSDILNLSKNVSYYFSENAIIFVYTKNWNEYMNSFDLRHSEKVKVNGKHKTPQGRMKNFYCQIGLPIALRKHSYVELNGEGQVQRLHTPFKQYDFD